MSSSRAALLVAVLAAALARPSPADDAAAPEGCWPMRDGCPARTGRALTRAVDGDLEPAWTYELPAGHEVDEEPRVWWDRVVVVARAPAGSRSVHVLRLSDGRLAAPVKSFPSNEPLDPVLDGDRVWVRAEPTRLEAWQVRAGQWKLLGAVAGRGALRDAIPVGDVVYALDGTSVAAFELGKEAPLWTLDGEYRGRLALLGVDLYALSYDEVGNGSLVAIDRRGGRRKADVFCAHHGAKSPPGARYESDIVVAERFVFVQHGAPVRTAGGGSATSSRIGRLAVGDGVVALTEAGLLDGVLPPAVEEKGWITIDDEEGKGPQLRHWFDDPKGPRFFPLADRDRHREFAQPRRITVAGRTAFVGPRAFDLDSRRITHDLGEIHRHRVVPARDRLLVVPAAGRLTALRPRGATLDAPLLLGRAAAAGPVEADGRVLLADGTAHVGRFTLDPARRRVALVVGKKTNDVALEDVDLVAADGRLLYVRSARETPRALRRLVRREHAAEYARLAKEAFKTNDAEFMGLLLDEAEDRGAADKDLEFPRKQQRELAKKPRKPVADVRAKLAARDQALRDAERAAIREALVGALDEPTWDVRRAFLGVVLESDPGDAHAAEIVRSTLPAWLGAPPDLKPPDWLETMDALRESKARPVVAPKGESGDITRQQRELGAALHTWRPDLVGFETDQLMVITPLSQPARIASCLSMGELTCRALEAIFSEGKHVRTDPYPMVLLLFETQEEYKAYSAKVFPPESSGRLEWSGGHFDPQSGVSRIFLPPSPDAFREVMLTYAHELTHHWIEERCPLFQRHETHPREDGPGYWIVEGMAEMVAQFRFDLAARTWDAKNPRAEALDNVANAKPEQLLPWSRVYGTSSKSFDTIDWKGVTSIPRRWELGWQSQLSPLRLFYMQSTATCLYLYHQGGATRAALLEYVRDFYTGALKPGGPDGIQARFGLTPDELGRRVVEWARTAIR